MSLPIGLQLYTVRDALDNDLEGTLRRIAQFGYAAVEPYNGSFMSGDQASKTLALFKELGFGVPAMHADLPLGDAQQRVIDTALMFGAQYVVVPWVAPETFETVAGIGAWADRLNEAAAVLAPHHLTMAYHNHWFEAHPVKDSGDYGLGVLASHLDPAVKLELDTYWVKVGGQDPAAVLARLADRVPLVHVKDGAAVAVEDPMVAVGDGSLDYKAIIAAGHPEWLIAELDRCATDMLEAVERSFQYLTREGLGHGR